MKPSTRDWKPRLIKAGLHYLNSLQELISRADSEQRVGFRPRTLCAALGLLSELCYTSLGGRERRLEIGRAGAMLSLLTKIDDQVIDAPSFHRGFPKSPEDLAKKTRAYLAPTLASIRHARPANEEPRSRLAAQLGQELRALSHHPSRLARVIDWIAQGWEIQVRAVVTLSRHPKDSNLEAVARVTGDISGAWLLMIAALGMLPKDAKRPLTDDEAQAFFDWGFHIQRADALADLGKDFKDGLINSYPDQLIFQKDPSTFNEILQTPSSESLYNTVASWNLDHACLPRPGQLQALHQRMSKLGEVPALLHWIHGFLTWRYLRHPQCQRGPDDPVFAPWTAHRQSHDDYLQAVSHLGPLDDQEAPCLEH